MADTPGFTPVTNEQKVSATPGFTPVAAPAATEPGPLARGVRAGVQAFTGSLGIDPAKVAEQPGVWPKIKEAGKEAGTSLAGAVASEWKQPTVGGEEGASKPLGPVGSFAARALFPAHLAARGFESLAGSAEKAARGFESGTAEGIGGGMGTMLGAKAQVAVPEHVTRAFKTAASLVERQPTVEQGKIAYVNTARKAVAVLEDAVNKRGVGARVRTVTDADALDTQRTGTPGGVHTADAQAAGLKAEAETKIPGNLYTYPAQMTMEQAKAQLTLMGRDAARLERAGKAPEAKAVWAQYDALREATQVRAEELGAKVKQPYGKMWSDYATEYKNFLKLQEGVLGHVMEGEHTSALNKLIEHAGQLPEVKKWFDKYGVDMKPLSDAAAEGGKLVEMTKQSSNALMGKIKLLSRHWALGTPAVIGMHYGAQAAGLGGGIGGFVLPLILAGKLGGLLDTMQVKELLYDLKRKVGPEQFQVAPGPVGPLEQLHRAATFGSDATKVPEAGPGYAGPERRVTEGESPLEYERRTRTTPPAKVGVEPPAALTAESIAAKAEEEAAAKRAESFLKGRGAEPESGRSELADKLKGARKDRSVFKGKRGGTK